MRGAKAKPPHIFSAKIISTFDLCAQLAFFWGENIRTLILCDVPNPDLQPH